MFLNYWRGRGCRPGCLYSWEGKLDGADRYFRFGDFDCGGACGRFWGRGNFYDLWWFYGGRKRFRLFCFFYPPSDVFIIDGGWGPTCPRLRQGQLGREGRRGGYA